MPMFCGLMTYIMLRVFIISRHFLSNLMKHLSLNKFHCFLPKSVKNFRLTICYKMILIVAISLYQTCVLKSLYNMFSNFLNSQFVFCELDKNHIFQYFQTKLQYMNSSPHAMSPQNII